KGLITESPSSIVYMQATLTGDLRILFCFSKHNAMSMFSPSYHETVNSFLKSTWLLGKVQGKDRYTTGSKPSDEYDDLKLFKSSTDKEIKRLDTKLTDIILKFNTISEQIDTIEQYSYNYNVKIIGIPQTQDRNKTAADTADIFINLFHSIGATNVTLQDIDIAHTIPTRGVSSKPNSIICKFTRRLAKEAVI
ncbi:Hypothetical predicted protein, partial [Paramuricea clavata]